MGKHKGLSQYSPRQVEEVMEILSMWDQIEGDFDALTPIEKSELSRSPRFKGFDANDTKNKQYYIASKMIKGQSCWPRFNGRYLNSHSIETLPEYRRMLKAYNCFGSNVSSRQLTTNELTKLLRAAIHPDHRTG